MSAVQPKCIFITGMGHSGTRLVTQMLSKHPDISVPMSILNRVAEYTPLHQFFINSMDQTPIDSAQYSIDVDELKSILDAYMSKIDKSKKFFVLKLPYYPLNCLDFFVMYFKHDIVLLNVKRPKEKVINSFLRKREDETLFLSNSTERMRQVKKLDLSIRKNYVESKDATEFFSELYDHTDRKICEWNRYHQDLQFINIDIEQFATSESFLAQTLRILGLSDDFTHQMMGVVNKNRLVFNFTGRLKKILPPSIRSLGSKTLGVLRGSRG